MFETARDARALHLEALELSRQQESAAVSSLLASHALMHDMPVLTARIELCRLQLDSSRLPLLCDFSGSVQDPERVHCRAPNGSLSPVDFHGEGLPGCIIRCPGVSRVFEQLSVATMLEGRNKSMSSLRNCSSFRNMSSELLRILAGADTGFGTIDGN